MGTRVIIIGMLLGLLLPTALLAGEKYTYRDDTVEVVIEKLDEPSNRRPILDITLTNKSDKPLTGVLLELRFYDASGRPIKKVELPVFAFQGNVGRVKYVAPEFAGLDVGPVHYTVVGE